MTDTVVEGSPIGRRVVIHVGYHRTGTSFLQTGLLRMLGERRHAPDVAEIKPIFDLFDDMEPSTAVVAKNLVIYSNENLSGSIDIDKPEVAAQLRTKVGDAKIVISIRSQYSIFRALYFLYLKGGGYLNFDSFVNERIGRVCNYLTLFDAYEAAFGEGSVFVVCQEDLKTSPVETMERLLEFIGVERAVANDVWLKQVKPSAETPLLKVMFYRNRLLKFLKPVLPKKLVWRILHMGVPGHRFLTRFSGPGLYVAPMIPTLRTRIEEAYGKDNQELARKAGLNLAEKVYPLAGEVSNVSAAA